MEEGVEHGAGGVVRVGRTIRRPAGRWTPTLQALLAHLRSVGFAAAPEPLGIDDHGREVVSFIDGDAGAAAWDHVVDDAGLQRFARFMHEYHAASASFVAPAGARWKLPPRDAGPRAVICHGDLVPWNVVWRDGTPVGLIDWEFARPGDPLDDLAWAAVWSVPLRRDEEAVDGWACWSEPPDRRRRLRLLIDAYGTGTPGAIVERAIEVLHRTVADVHALAEQGFEPQSTWVRSGDVDQDRVRADWIERNRSLLI